MTRTREKTPLFVNAQHFKHSLTRGKLVMTSDQSIGSNQFDWRSAGGQVKARRSLAVNSARKHAILFILLQINSVCSAVVLVAS